MVARPKAMHINVAVLIQFLVEFSAELCVVLGWEVPVWNVNMYYAHIRTA